MDIVTEWLLPQVQQNSSNFVLQLDGTPQYVGLGR